jgi:hypothetical protein
LAKIREKKHTPNKFFSPPGRKLLVATTRRKLRRFNIAQDFATPVASGVDTLGSVSCHICLFHFSAMTDNVHKILFHSVLVELTRKLDSSQINKSTIIKAHEEGRKRHSLQGNFLASKFFRRFRSYPNKGIHFKIDDEVLLNFYTRCIART